MNHIEIIAEIRERHERDNAWIDSRWTQRELSRHNDKHRILRIVDDLREELESLRTENNGRAYAMDILKSENDRLEAEVKLLRESVNAAIYSRSEKSG